MANNGSAWTAGAIVVVGVMALGTAKQVIQQSPVQAAAVGAGAVVAGKLIRGASGPGGQAARDAAKPGGGSGGGGGATGTSVPTGQRVASGPAGASRTPSGPKQARPNSQPEPESAGGGVRASSGPGVAADVPAIGSSAIAGPLGQALAELTP